MAMEIDEAVIRVDNHAEIDEVEPIEISDDEARRVRLYENFYQVNAIDPALYAAHDVKRGLRNADGTGVLAGMTNISNVHGYVMSDGEKMPAEGSLRLRGYEGSSSESASDGGSMSNSFIDDVLSAYSADIEALRDVCRPKGIKFMGARR